MSTTLPLDFPSLQAEARRFTGELLGWSPITLEWANQRHISEYHVRAHARLLSNLACLASQSFWSQNLAARLGRPLTVLSPPQLVRDIHCSQSYGLNVYWFMVTGPNGWLMWFHDNPAKWDCGDGDLRVPGINEVPPTDDGAIEVLWLALHAAYGVAP